MKKELHYLDQINRVEAPPYLFTRIQQRIIHLRENRRHPVWAWSVSLSFVALLTLNALVFLQSQKINGTLDTLVETMHLATSNSLYE